MAKQIERLTAMQVTKLAKPGNYHDGAGLYLQVALGGSKSWLFRYVLAGRQRWMGLGSVTTFSLAEARARARDKRKLLADGVDPIDQKHAKLQQTKVSQATVTTFDKAAEQYIETNRSAWKNGKHVDQWRSTLKTYASPIIGKLPIQEVTPVLILRILQPIWTVKTETASRLRGRMEKILDWAKVHGYRSGDNPAAWRGHLAQVLPRPSKVSNVDHHAALPWQEVAGFMTKLRLMPGISALATQFIILTACRTREVLGARWDEVDLEKRLWVIPASRMKAGKEHRVPLSDAAVQVLANTKSERCGNSDFLFPGRLGGELSNMSCLALLKRMGSIDITVHGFRSTFRDWAAEKTSHPRDVCELALAHAITDSTEAAYRRGDLLEKRTQLMSDWASFCMASPASTATRPRKVLLSDDNHAQVRVRNRLNIQSVGAVSQSKSA